MKNKLFVVLFLAVAVLSAIILSSCDALNNVGGASSSSANGTTSNGGTSTSVTVDNSTASSVLEDGEVDGVISDKTEESNDDATEETKPSEHEHFFTDWKVKRYPTCTNDGLNTRYCIYCQTEEEEVVAARGHEEAVAPGKAPTCTEAGTTDATYCLVCFETLIESEPIEKTGHTEKIIEGKSPTCFETGISNGKICTVCSLVIDEQEKMGIIDHIYDENRLCTMCGKEKASDGVTYVLSVDKTYYIVQTGVTCTDTRVVIASDYEGLPVKEIASYAFVGNGYMEELVIPNSVEAIGKSAFEGCNSLKKLYIGTGVERVDYDAFAGCTQLEGVYIKDLVKWCRIAFAGANTGYVYSNPLFLAGNIYLNNELIVDLVIPREIYQIKPFTFMGATCLKTVYIPCTVETIASYAFSKTTADISCEARMTPILWSGGWIYSSGATATFDVGEVLSSGDYDYIVDNGQAYLVSYKGSEVDVVVPEYVDSLPVASIGMAFCGTNIETIYLPNSVGFGSGGAFASCPNLKSIMVSDDNPNYKTIDGSLYSKDGCTLIKYVTASESGEVVIPEFVEVIGMHAFSTSSAYSRVTIPVTVKKLEDRSFYKSSIKTIIFESPTPPEIGENVAGYTWNNYQFCVVVPVGSAELYENVPDHWWQSATIPIVEMTEAE